MIYCINPYCTHRENDNSSTVCQGCGASLLIKRRYQLLKPLRPLDIGGYTEVFEVLDTKNKTHKVLKVWKERGSRFLHLFRQEATILEQLYHEGIPRLYEDFSIKPNSDHYPFDEPLNCLVIEKIEGETLSQWLERETRLTSLKKALDWLKQLVDIIGYLHENKCFHRDIKPDNIMIRYRQGKEQLILIDFGTIREINEDYYAKLSLNELTVTVSAGYTAPEQLQGKSLPQSDFYALGCTFIHLLTGIHPLELSHNLDTNEFNWSIPNHFGISPINSFIIKIIINFLTHNDYSKRPDNIGMIKEILAKPTEYALYHFITKVIPWSKIRLFSLISIAITLPSTFLFLSVEIKRLEEQGVEYLKEGSYLQAKEVLEQAKRYSYYTRQNNDNIYNNLGLAYDLLGEKGKSVENYQIALELNPKNQATKYNLGVLAEDAGQVDQALGKYEALARENPFSFYGINALNAQARLYILHKRNYQRAYELAEQGLSNLEELSRKEGKSDNYQYLEYTFYKNLGWAKLQEGDYQQAKKYLLQSLEGKVKRTESYCLLAQTEESLGQEAKKYWENCLKGENTTPEVLGWKLEAERRSRQNP